MGQFAWRNICGQSAVFMLKLRSSIVQKSGDLIYRAKLAPLFIIVNLELFNVKSASPFFLPTLRPSLRDYLTLQRAVPASSSLPRASCRSRICAGQRFIRWIVSA